MKTHYLLLIDMSGSMAGVQEITKKSVDDLIKTTARASQENKLDTRLSLAYFDDVLEVQYLDKAVGECKPISNYAARNGTNIYDNVVNFIERFEKEVGGNDPVVLTLFTDGDHGSYGMGRQRSQQQMADYLRKLDRKRWTVTYVTPSYNWSVLAAASGFPVTNAMKYETTQIGTRDAFFKIGAGIKRYIELRAEKPEADLSEDFFGGVEKATTMNVRGLTCVLNLPDAAQGEKVDGLPPYAPVEAHVVDEYPNCPASWMHGSNKASSYFVATKEGDGMWLDFNGNWTNEHDVAIVISVQGINPVTGQKTSELRLEKYETKCPLHDVEFQQDHYCPQCQFKWPSQNYLTTTSTPHNQLWLDGFRTPDGTVKQYVFTEEEAKGVAANLIGQDRVYAIGVAFYRSKKAKPKREYQDISAGGAAGGSYSKGFGLQSRSLRGVRGMSAFSDPAPACAPGTTWTRNRISDTFSVTSSSVKTEKQWDSVDGTAGPSGDEGLELSDFETIGGAPVKTLEVGAGADIKQEVHVDPNSIEYWEEEPYGLIYINYTDRAKLKQILAQGKREDKKHGFLTGIVAAN